MEHSPASVLQPFLVDTAGRPGVSGSAMVKLFRALVWGTDGQELVECALLVALISLVSVVAVAGLGVAVTAAFQTVVLQLEQ